MASVDTLTFDQNPPHRAGVSELGGGAKEDSVPFPPDPVKHPTAGDFNQFTQQHAAANRVLPLARLWVRFATGTPSIFAVQALGSNVVADSFDVTDVGAGETLISWKTGTDAPDGALPAAVGVKADQTDDVEIDRGPRAILTTSGSDPAARVKSSLAGTPTDCNFCLEIF